MSCRPCEICTTGEFCSQADMLDDPGCPFIDHFRDATKMEDEYLSGNKVGIVEWLEMAAFYHDRLANKQLDHGVWDENGNPRNGSAIYIEGSAIYIEAHRRNAAEIRAMKPA